LGPDDRTDHSRLVAIVLLFVKQARRFVKFRGGLDWFRVYTGTRERERGAARIEQRDGRKADASLAERTARGGSRFRV
jgi:hypothetical protein